MYFRLTNLTINTTRPQPKATWCHPHGRQQNSGVRRRMPNGGGTVTSADLRRLRRAIARTYSHSETDVVFPAARVHGYTDESIVVESAVASGVSHEAAEHGIARFHDERANVMSEGEEELARDQPAAAHLLDVAVDRHRRLWFCR
jgi:hypothetical protein